MGAWPSATPIDTTDLDAGTDSPANARSDLKTAVDDLNLVKAATATETTQGPIEIATQAETDAGTDDTRAVTPKKLKDRQIYHGALAYRSTNQSIANNTAYVAINFDAEDHDTDTIHDNATNNERLTIPTGWTKARITGQISFSSNSTGIREIIIYKNGAVFAGGAKLTLVPYSGSYITAMNITTGIITVAATDYFELKCFQNSGASLNAIGGSDSTWFSIELIE